MNKYYWLQQHLKRLQKDAVLHQYQILNWKNVSVSQWAGPVGPLDEWAISVIDGQGGAVRRNSMPHHVNIKLFASYVFHWKVCSKYSRVLLRRWILGWLLQTMNYLHKNRKRDRNKPYWLKMILSSFSPHIV